MLRRSVAALAAAAVGAVSAAMITPAHAADPAASSRAAQPAPTRPTYSYAHAVRESVWVQTRRDSDGDGRPDRVAVDIVRPRGATGVPTILEASPYYACCGRGNEYQVKSYDAHGRIRAMPLFYDNYFVPRGYAYASIDLPGTNRSQGCPDLGGPVEVGAVVDVIRWLRGNGTAWSQPVGGREVGAGWSAGRVGMIGKSWDASVANGVAATGVRGLRTVVDVSGISSWYGYDRFGGVLRYPDAVSTLEGIVAADASACGGSIAAQNRRASDATGNENAYWLARDYRLDVGRVHAAMLVAHGLNDLNVTTDQFASWWTGLAAHDVPRQIWLSQDGHVDPFDYRRPAWVHQLHRWFDHWLVGVPNGVMQQPQARIQRADGTWTSAASWPRPGSTAQSWSLTRSGFAGRLTAEGASAPGQVQFTDRPSLGEAAAVADPAAEVPGRVAFVTRPLTTALDLSGVGSVRMRLKLDHPDAELTVRLVDYGTQRRIDYLSSGEGITTLKTRSCWGASDQWDSACYERTAPQYVTSDVDVLARGHLDAAHRDGLDRRVPVVPGHWFTVSVPLAPVDGAIAVGHRLGLVVTQSDTEQTDPIDRGATETIDLSGSSLALPVVPATGD